MKYTLCIRSQNKKLLYINIDYYANFSPLIIDIKMHSTLLVKNYRFILRIVNDIAKNEIFFLFLVVTKILSLIFGLYQSPKSFGVKYTTM